MEFKKLSAVDTIKTVSETANVLIEENGEIKKIHKDGITMNPNKLSAVDSVSETANVLIEENGEIKKAPKTAVGGAGGNLVFIFTSDFYEDSNVGFRPLFKSDGIYEAIDQLWNNLSGLNLNVYNYIGDRFRFEAINYVVKSTDEDCYLIEIGTNGYYIKCYPNGRIYCDQFD